MVATCFVKRLVTETASKTKKVTRRPIGISVFPICKLIGNFHMLGPEWLRLFFQGVVVIVGFLILSGASNTALIGSNAVLNRVSEDRVLSDWFRKPHPRFGTTFRILNCIAILQLITIILSKGNIYLLGEAYAFGVLWSFTFETLAVIVLRYKNKEVEISNQLAYWKNRDPNRSPRHFFCFAGCFCHQPLYKTGSNHLWYFLYHFSFHCVFYFGAATKEKIGRGPSRFGLLPRFCEPPNQPGYSGV